MSVCLKCCHYAPVYAAYRVLMLLAYVHVITSGGEQIMKLFIMKFSPFSVLPAGQKGRGISHSFVFITRHTFWYVTPCSLV